MILHFRDVWHRPEYDLQIYSASLPSRSGPTVHRTKHVYGFQLAAAARPSWTSPNNIMPLPDYIPHKFELSTVGLIQHFPVQFALLSPELLPIEIAFRDFAGCPRQSDPFRWRIDQPRDTRSEALRIVGDPYAGAVL
jgi:hypothetical protein